MAVYVVIEGTIGKSWSMTNKAGLGKLGMSHFQVLLAVKILSGVFGLSKQEYCVFSGYQIWALLKSCLSDQCEGEIRMRGLLVHSKYR